MRKRADSYHDLETIFLPIGWGDQILVRSADVLSMSCSDESLPVDARNLCMKAAIALHQFASVEQGAHIHLEKRVPMGAGLGGGSADAATTLLALTDLWQLDVAPSDLHDIAASLGSDVPFFLTSAPMLGTGRGEILTPFRYHFPFHLVVVMPNVMVSTAEAYRSITPNTENRPNLLEVVTSNDLARWRMELVNDFEAPIMGKYTEIAEVKAQLQAFGAGYAAMSGSGAAVFGVFEDNEKAQHAFSYFKAQGLQTWAE